jgi:thiamine-monophosphate kinase
MNRLEEILENSIINTWAKHFLHAPHQINRSHETDAELIASPGDERNYLAITIDTVSEEITEGLYKDPYTMGWVTVMVSLSDLAAVGADPLGLVISVCIEPNRDKSFAGRVADGMNDACQKMNVFILGGDTNFTPTIALTGCAFGLVPRDKLLTRKGCKHGDSVFITSGIGMGNAFGLVRLANLPEKYFPEKLYRPSARLKQGQFLRNYANCCMDTSDGLLATLDQLMRINQFGFVVDCDWAKILSPEVYQFCNLTKTPHWLMTAGPHGEFELLFTVSSEKENELVKTIQSKDMKIIKLGKVQDSPVITLNLPSGRNTDIDVAPLRNLLYTVEGDMQRYLYEFKAFGEKWGIK